MNNTLFRTLLKEPDDASSWVDTRHVWSILQELLTKTKQRDMAKYQDMDFDAEFLKSDEKVSRLLAQYATYASIVELKIRLSQISKDSFQRLTLPLDTELNKIWDEMKFDNPYIWMKYKVLAYKHDEKKKIETIWDLIVHCSPGGDICSKRMRFFNICMWKYFSVDVHALDPQMKVDDFLNTSQIKELSIHREFILEWLYYEYYQVGEKVAKWSNYNEGTRKWNWNNYI